MAKFSLLGKACEKRKEKKNVIKKSDDGEHDGGQKAIRIWGILKTTQASQLLLNKRYKCSVHLVCIVWLHEKKHEMHIFERHFLSPW